MQKTNGGGPSFLGRYNRTINAAHSLRYFYFFLNTNLFWVNWSTLVVVFFFFGLNASCGLGIDIVAVSGLGLRLHVL